MPIYINHQPIDLTTLSPDKVYQGNDEVKIRINQAWRDIQSRFFSKGKDVVFKTPSIRSGMGQGNRGYGCPRAVYYLTKNQGRVHVAWADSQEERNGKKFYKPVSLKITPETKTMRLTERDIEKILWLWCFAPETDIDHVTGKSTKLTVLEDLQKEAEAFEMDQVAQSCVPYWLYRKDSRLYSNEAALYKLSLAWGLNPHNKSLAEMKKELAKAVDLAEKSGSTDRAQFNYDAFDRACQKIVDGNDTAEYDVMALIQRCLIAKTIGFDKEQLKWYLAATDGTPIRTICKVPAHMIQGAKLLLRSHLLGSSNDRSDLEATVSTDTSTDFEDVCYLSAPLPDVITEDVIVNDFIPWADCKRIYKHIGNTENTPTKNKVHPALVEYFVTQGKTIKWEVRT